ncbi:LOW QUALITY PROTEIN: matrix-remodeling-associated protein 5 [Ornithorhynchus anatinus]|uniref:LOW QUALITY PROTEIN: matrix-remodeling-associated protein 5 n=1 Tax=Ornithorhynchus anatinus TaxID=9258 RepID=UPI0010A7579D|nr:LOW QUALITY PROTEIN: matrix-remodeling-associated protein 5 [Ornithorhynchus anatinus]
MKSAKMQKRAAWWVLSTVLIISLGHPRATQACPHQCACYIPTEVHCTFRSLASVPATISKHVERINLGFNSIQAISENSFAGLTKLELLMIHGNNIPSIPNGALKDLISLQVFKFSYNQLQVITGETFRGLASLMRLHLDHNKIEFIHPRAFGGLTSLRLLHLEGNLLRQLPPGTFSTFSLFEHFRLSTVRHLYLSDNAIRTLPAGMFYGMPLLENVYLHGNPWACDCRLKWLLRWDAAFAGVLKCKKDKAYEGGQLCSLCSSPKQLHKQEIQTLKDLTCVKPLIQSPLKLNSSSSSTEQEDEVEEEEEEEGEEEGDGHGRLSADAFQSPPWNITLNMTDEHGNKVDLACAIKKPVDLSQIRWNQSDPYEIDIDATIALDVACPMNRENYEKLWKLIAYYSEVPVKLRREQMLGRDPAGGYRYRQDTDHDALYYTGVRARVAAHPDWVTQPSVDLQFNRLRSTAEKVLLSFSTRFSQIVSTKDVGGRSSGSWVMIERNESVDGARTVLAGSGFELRCDTRASESPEILWVLPDGSVLRAPSDGRDGRFSVREDGRLTLRAAGYPDSGPYRCVARVRDETDSVVHRVSVQPPEVRPGDGEVSAIEKRAGEPITLPCGALAIPEAQLSWILPSREVVSDFSNSSRGFLLENGTLLIPGGQVADTGYYRCVAVNRQGMDRFTVKVTVRRKGLHRSANGGKPKKHSGPQTSPRTRADVIDDEGGSGTEDVGDPSEKHSDREVPGGAVPRRNGDDPGSPAKKNPKGRRKMKFWKGVERAPESNVAEGRRVFESRRRINMASKQINPQHWANILAKVRGRNLPRGTGGPLVSSPVPTATAPTARQEVTPPLPVPSPPVKPVARMTLPPEEASSDVSFLSQDELFSSAGPPAESDNDQRRFPTPESEPKPIGPEPREPTHFPGEPDGAYATDAPSFGTEPPGTTPPTSGARHTAPSPGGPYAEEAVTGSSSAGDVGGRASPAVSEEPPLDTVGLAGTETFTYFDPAAETDSRPDGGAGVHFGTSPLPPADLVPVRDDDGFGTPHPSRVSSPTSPFEESVPGEDPVPASPNPQIPPDRLKTTDGWVSPPPTPSTDQNTVGGLPTGREDGTSETESSSGKRKHDSETVSVTGFPLRLKNPNPVASLKDPETIPPTASKDGLRAPEATAIPDRESTASSSSVTRHSRRRPHGRRRLRPNRLRQGRKRVRPTASAPAETASSPTRSPITKGAANAPTSASVFWDRTSVPDLLAKGGDLAAAVTKSAPRRKGKKRPSKNKGARTTSLPRTFETQPSAPAHTTPGPLTPSAADVLPSPVTVPLLVVDSPEGMNRKGHPTATSQRLPSQEPRWETPFSVLEEKEVKRPDVTTNVNHFQTTALVPGIFFNSIGTPTSSKSLPVSESEEESLPSPPTATDATSPSSISLSSISSSAEAAPLSSSTSVTPQVTPSISSSVLPSGVPVGDSRKTAKDSSVFQVSPTTDLPAKADPTPTAPEASQRDERPTVLSPYDKTRHQSAGKVTTDAPEVTSRRDSKKTTLAAEDERNRFSQDFHGPPFSTPAKLKKSASPIPPAASKPFAKPVTTPSAVFSRTVSSSPRLATKESKENTIFNHVGTPDNEGSEADGEGAALVLEPNGSTTSSSNQNVINVPPRQERFQEIPGNTSNNSLSRAPNSHHHHGVLPFFRQRPAPPPPKSIPSRVAATSPSPATRGSFPHRVTSQPPLRFTNEPGITAYLSRVGPEGKTSIPPAITITTTTASTTVTALPSSRPRPVFPGRFGHPGQNRFHADPNAPANNHIPDPRESTRRVPGAGIPYYAGGRFPFLFNQNGTFARPGIPSKPQAPTILPLVNKRERKVTPGPFPRKAAQQSPPAVLSGPPPPTTQPPTPTPSPTAGLKTASPTHRFLTPQTTPSAGQSSGRGHSGNFKLPSGPNTFGGGHPASNFWPPGEKPRIVTKSAPTLSIPAETDAVLPCEATGEPRPFVTWTRIATGALMTPNTKTHRFEVLRNGTFVIRNAQPQDGGRYLCTATNLHGLDKMAVALSVAARPPEMATAHYRDVTVYLGDTIAMECLADGVPPPHISWIFPDRKVWQTVSTAEARITLHRNRTLSIKDATFSDRGVYKCVAGNAAGTDSLAVRLHVAALPPIIQQEKRENISLPPGIGVNIHCSAKAAPPPTIRWRLLDGTQIRPSQFANGNVFVFPNGTLYLRHVAPEDSGTYECVAANAVGVARRTVRLTVRQGGAEARIARTSPRQTDVTYGGTLRLDCSASGDPRPTILWRLPSKRMIDSLFSLETRTRVLANGSLVVQSVTDGDAGDYLCVARNRLGDDSAALRVNVTMRPARIERREEPDRRVAYGGGLTVDCVASGLPVPDVSWSLPDGSTVNALMQSDDGGGGAKRYVLFHNGTLYFHDVGLGEQGDYTCLAENPMGRDEMRIRVRVLAEPAAIRNKGDSVADVLYGEAVSVACESRGEPAPTVTWLSPANLPIPPASAKYRVSRDGTLLIREARRSDGGNYTCVVRNGAGEDRKVVRVRVSVRRPRINGSPDAVTAVREIAARGDRKLIDCRAEGVPAPRVLWAFPQGVVLPAPYYGRRITVHRNGTLDVRDLRESDSVRLVCIGRNEGGEARLVVQLTVLDPRGGPVFRDPVDEEITAAAGHTINLNCSAEGRPDPTVLWILPDGSEVPGGRRLGRFFHKGDGVLHISALAPADAGPYRCLARNPAGSAQRRVSLGVGPGPARPVSVPGGETLLLHCGPPGSRPVGVSWTLPGGRVLDRPQTAGRFTLFENGSLSVREASGEDRGTYLCRAAAVDHGPPLTSVPVAVVAPTAPRVVRSRAGSSVRLDCAVAGVPGAEVTWRLPDGSPLTAGPRARLYGNKLLHPQGALLIQRATPGDAGFYSCTARNQLGSHSQTTYVHVL